MWRACCFPPDSPACAAGRVSPPVVVAAHVLQRLLYITLVGSRGFYSSRSGLRQGQASVCSGVSSSLSAAQGVVGIAARQHGRAGWPSHVCFRVQLWILRPRPLYMCALVVDGLGVSLCCQARCLWNGLLFCRSCSLAGPPGWRCDVPPVPQSLQGFRGSLATSGWRP